MSGQLPTTDATLPMTPVIPPNPDSQPYFDGLADGRLKAPRCNQCETVIWYPRHLCVDCGTTDVSWIELSGDATVYSYSIVHRAPGPFGQAVPYVLAYVELAEGPHAMTNIVGCEPETVSIGMPLRAVIETDQEGNSLLRFAPRD